MTSKELFKNWKKYYISEFPCDRKNIDELEQIEKDLEILEILKKYLTIEIEDEPTYNINRYAIKLRNKDIGWCSIIYVTKQEKDLFKEWLEK